MEFTFVGRLKTKRSSPVKATSKQKKWRMSMHLKWNNAFNRVLASSVAALMATTSLHAIPRDPCEPPAPPVCCEEPKPGPFAFAYPFDMNLNCPKDFYVHVDA